MITRVFPQFPGYFPRPTAGSSKERLSSPVVRITLRGTEPVQSAPQSARRRPGWSEAISVGREPRGMLRGQSPRQLLRLSSPAVRITLGKKSSRKVASRREIPIDLSNSQELSGYFMRKVQTGSSRLQDSSGAYRLRAEAVAMHKFLRRRMRCHLCI